MANFKVTIRDNKINLFYKPWLTTAFISEVFAANKNLKVSPEDLKVSQEDLTSKNVKLEASQDAMRSDFAARISSLKDN